MTKRSRAQNGRLSRVKGATFERTIANALKPYFTDSRRQPQSQIKQIKAIAATTPEFHPCLTDVVAGPFGIECKHRKVLPHIEDTLQQAIEDVGQSGKIPVAVHRPSPGSMYDIQVLMLYYSDRMYMTWPVFLGHCERIAREEKAASVAKCKPVENSKN